MARVWELFDYPCGQRLAPVLRAQVERLRSLGELRCSDRVAELLKRASPTTLDRLLAHERQVRQLKRRRRAPIHRLPYQRVPVKLPHEWDRDGTGNLRIDFVVHCGRSMAGEYAHTFPAVDIASGWREGEPRMGRSQKASEESFDGVRQRFPFRVREIHPDNDSALLNELPGNYCRRRRIALSRSRPYEKNGNAWVEQKNWTHVRKVVGYRRYGQPRELEVMRRLNRALADFQNFFQPVMKPIGKVREGGKVRRVYDEPKTPCQRLLESGAFTGKQRKSLQTRYETLNPAELSRRIQALRDRLFDLVENKDQPESRFGRRHGPGIETDARPQQATAGHGGRLRKPSWSAGPTTPGDLRIHLSKASAQELHQRIQPKEKALRAACNHSEGPADSSEPVRRIGLGSPLGRDPSRIRHRVQREKTLHAFGYILT